MRQFKDKMETEQGSIEAELLNYWDLRAGFQLHNIISSQISIEHDRRKRRENVMCGDVDLLTDDDNLDFADIEKQCLEFEADDALTYNFGEKKVEKQENPTDCLLGVQALSVLDSKYELKQPQPRQISRNPIKLELTNSNITQNELLSNRFEYRRTPGSKSMVSYLSSVVIEYLPNDQEEDYLVFFLDNPRNFNRVTFDCDQVTIQDAKGNSLHYNLTCVVFKNRDSSDVALLVKREWVFYGGKDNSKDPPQHLRKMVPDSDLNNICAVPYILIFTREQKI